MSILITGANRGIGLALARRYSLSDASVIGTTRSTSPAPGVEWHKADLRDPAQIDGLATALSGRPLDLLICNAGVYLDKGQRLGSGFAPDLWAETFAVNVTGVFLTIQALLPNLRAASGKIAILSSIMGSDSRAPGGSYIYRASKAAVLNLGRNLAVDLRADGVAVGIYHPGWVQTDMGGAAADVTVEEAVVGLEERFAALSLAITGCFETYAGEALPF
jgi:NAD(P)-dependent dehydrogenase (short-subunit alcohol dehydrogenase family)